MDISFLIELIQKHGYISMFIFNWLLLFGLPIPNEVAAALSGVLTEISDFKPTYAFLSAYAGLITSNTFAYFIGRSLGHRLLMRLSGTRLKQPISRFSEFLEKRGEWAIALSFFLPGIRWAMPYVVGANRFPVMRYMMFAYTAGFVWLLVYFNVGRTFPYAYETILEHVQVFLILLSFVVVMVVLLRYLYRAKFTKK
ncbi:DedA family protein [Planococcus kocurii]|uniref:Alkaline phosphatase n=1 Tax=Planococcus faecalis TaxID=1598147 RepID=A0ABN4XNB0_9BACL|nr:MULTISPECIES: DedA family protein [Planococcus]AQU79427.1 alkaline phosphatase [Planococcus faecalis]KAA0956464.1 DedA family protein [Planococcus sp. ANT_H30]